VNKSQPDSSPSRPAGDVLDRAADLVVLLRERCPWDARQTPESLCRYLLEESHEAADAILTGDADAIADELGDLLLNLAFQVVIGEERGTFSRDEVFARLERKVRRRHPHVYGTGEMEPWQAVKARERAAGEGEDGDEGRLEAVPRGLPPLRRAQRLQAAAAEIGFDWPSAEGALSKVREEVGEIEEAIRAGDADRVEDEVGDLLFSAVNVARLADADAMTALLRANAKFHARFSALEVEARKRGLDLRSAGIEEMEAVWQAVKRDAPA
jgi:nucleoside triphosphate diphosphatase